MAYSKSSPNNKFAPSTVVSMASRTSNRPMSYGQVYENLNYEMGMHKISDTDRKWMACRKNFINSNRRAFEELQIKVGNLIEAGKIPPNYANNLDKICTEDEFNSIQAEVNRMESSRAIDRTGHFRNDTPANPADAATQEKINENQKKLADNKIEFEKRFNEQADAKKAAKDAKNIAKINFKNAKRDFDENQNQEKKDTMETAEQKLNEASEAYKKLTETFNDKVQNKVDDKINKRKGKITENDITNDVEILKDADKILLQNVPETNVIKKLAEIKKEKIKNKKNQPKTSKVKTEEQKQEILKNKEKNKEIKKKIGEDVRADVEAAKILAEKDGLLIRTVTGKYIPNINKNDIGTLKKVKEGKKAFTISGHTAEDITTVGKKYMLKKNIKRAANNKWSESLKKLKGDNVKMVGPDKFNNATDEQKINLRQNLQNYITVMDDYIKKLPDNDETKPIKQEKLNEAKELLEQYDTQTAPQAATEVDYTAQKRADAQRISAMDRDYRQSFQAAYQQKPFKADRYKLGSSDMHDWPSSAGSSVSSNRDSWYAEWNANRSY